MGRSDACRILRIQKWPRCTPVNEFTCEWQCCECYAVSSRALCKTSPPQVPDLQRCVREAWFCISLPVHVLAADTATEQGRDRGPVPAAGPQRAGPGRETVEDADDLQLGPRGSGEPGGPAAAGRLGHRFLNPGKALAACAEGLEFTGSRPLGGMWALDGYGPLGAVDGALRLADRLDGVVADPVVTR
jgi:hypothetical protein